MLHKWTTTTLIILCLIIGFNSYAKNAVKFKLRDGSVYTSADTARPLFLFEIVMEMAKHLDIQPTVEFLPWRRAQVETINSTNAIIFPLTRTQSREPNYKWLCKLFDVPVAFITRQGDPIVNSFEEAAKLRKFGVLEGTPQEERLNQIMKETGLEFRIARLKSKEVYDFFANSTDLVALYGPVPEALNAWEVKGYTNKLGNLQFGTPLQTLPLWVATGKKADAIKPQAWTEALNKVKASGEFDKILNKHFKYDALPTQ